MGSIAIPKLLFPLTEYTTEARQSLGFHKAKSIAQGANMYSKKPSLA